MAKLSIIAFNEMEVIKKHLKPEMIEALSDQLHNDNLIIGNDGLGIFGSIFDKTHSSHAIAFKKKCGLRMEPDGKIATIEVEWKNSPDAGIICASYLADSLNYSQLKDNVTMEDEQNNTPEITDDVIKDWVQKADRSTLEYLGLISVETVEVEKIVEIEKIVEKPITETITNTVEVMPEFMVDAAKSIVNRTIGMYGKHFTKQYHPDVWAIRKALKTQRKLEQGVMN